MFSNAQSGDLWKWHYRFGHLNMASLRKMANENIVYGLKSINKSIDLKGDICETCAKSKLSVKPFPKAAENRENEVLSLIHTDICGPMNKQSAGGARYFATFIDDYSRYTFVYFLKTRDQILNAFKDFVVFAERQCGKKIKAVRSDNGREYVSRDFENFMSENGIKRQLTVPYTPQQNGVAERANRTLVEMARSMLVHSGTNESLWGEAVRTAAYLRNRSETKALNCKTPYEVWTGKKPIVSHLRIFGSKAIALNKAHKMKFRAKGTEYVMIGYSMTAKAYRLYCPESKKVIESRDVVFLENDYGGCASDVKDMFLIDESESVRPQQTVDEGHEDVEEEDVQQESEAEVNEEDCITEGTDTEHYESAVSDEAEPSTPSEARGRGRPKMIKTGKPGRPRKKFNMLNLLKAEDVVIPATINDVNKSKMKQEWSASIQKEIDALEANKTWELVDLPEGKKPIGCKWVFGIKVDKGGYVERFKSRLVAKGCAQLYGVDYFETFSPVVRYSSVRMIMALAVKNKLFLHQMDVSSAYLNSELSEDVYMKQPDGFVSDEYPNKVLKLKKSLYGLKQSGREWNVKLDSVLTKLGFVPCVSEPCVYTRNGQGNFNIIAIYVDDLLIASSTKEDLLDIKASIANEFDVVDGGQLNHFLGIEVDREGETGNISIGHKQYVEQMLHAWGMSTCKPVATPLEAGHQVKCDDPNCETVNEKSYQSLIGSLMYLAITTRPDILHSVGKLAQRNANPHKEHEVAAKRVLRYLKGTADLKIHYQDNGKPLHCYVDADWANDSTDRKSYSGYVFLEAGGAISWESKKQSLVALSSTEAEYIALSTAAKEATYLKKLLHEMGFDKIKTVILYCDNQSAQCIAKNPTLHNRSKHIDIKYHHVRELYSKNEIDIQYICTNDMTSDVLTKNLQKIKHVKCITEMNCF